VEALAYGERAQAWDATTSYAVQLVQLRGLQGRLAEVEDLIRASARSTPTYTILKCVLAHTLAVLGRRPESHHLFEALAADGFADVPFNEGWLVSLTLLAEAAVLMDDARRAATLHGLLLPYAGRIAGSYSEISTGSVSRYLGVLASKLRRFDEAVAHFENALTVNQQIGALPELARANEDFARLLLEHGTQADAGKARKLLEQALEMYGALGMRFDLDRAFLLQGHQPG
jgi:tetratricopeptide (TPR) repeat protein